MLEGLSTSGRALFDNLTISDVLKPVLMNPTLLGTVFTVSLATASGRTYILEFKNALNNTTWSSGESVPGDDTILTLTDPNATGPERIYRVRVE